MASGAKLIGREAMQAKLRRFMAKFPSAEAAALFFEAGVEMSESKKRCPVYSPPRGGYVDHVGGTLRASGHVLKPVTEGRKISVDLVYGGAAEAYAVVQHEGLDFHHNVGQARYLASVLEESEATMAQRIAARVQFNEEMLR